MADKTSNSTSSKPVAQKQLKEGRHWYSKPCDNDMQVFMMRGKDQRRTFYEYRSRDNVYIVEKPFKIMVEESQQSYLVRNYEPRYLSEIRLFIRQAYYECTGRWHPSQMQLVRLRSLDNLKMATGDKRTPDKVVELEQRVNLLKAMLTVDPTKRITPREVLSHPFIHIPSTIPPSRVIFVQPAPPENTLHLEDVESEVSLQAELKKTSESPVTLTENDTASAPGDSTTCGEKQSPRSPPPVTELASIKKKTKKEEEKKREKKKKKKKKERKKETQHIYPFKGAICSCPNSK